MSSPKPTPTRRGTLFGLRRKSSTASLALSAPIVSPPTEAPSNGEPSSSSLTQDLTSSNDSTSLYESKRSPPKPKRGFTSLIPTRTSTDAPSSDSAVLSDAGSDHSLNLHPKASSSRSASFLRRLSSSSTKKHSQQIEELQREKAGLEEQVASLTTEKSALQAALEAAKAEGRRFEDSSRNSKEERDAERRRIIDEAAAQLVAKEVEVKSLTSTIDELKEELERVKESEQTLLSQSLSASLDMEAKIAEVTTQIRAAALLEKQSAEKQLVEAQALLDTKDRALKELEGEAFILKEQLASTEMEVRRLKEAKAILETDKAKRLSASMPMPTKPAAGWFSVTGWTKTVTSWLTYGYVRSMADESSRYGESRHPACIYLA